MIKTILWLTLAGAVAVLAGCGPVIPAAQGSIDCAAGCVSGNSIYAWPNQRGHT
jgi:hypothetical protein